jgi:hypothetical protein
MNAGKIEFDVIADDMETADLIVDNRDRTFYSSPNSDTCYIGLDFLEDRKLEIHWIKFKGLFGRNKKEVKNYRNLIGTKL